MTTVPSFNDLVRLTGQVVESTLGTIGAFGKYLVECGSSEARARQHFQQTVKSLSNRVVEVAEEPQRRELETNSENQLKNRRGEIEHKIAELKTRFKERPDKLESLEKLAERFHATHNYARTGGNIRATERYYRAINKTLDGVNHELSAMKIGDEVAQKLSHQKEVLGNLKELLAKKSNTGPEGKDLPELSNAKQQLVNIEKLLNAQKANTGFLESEDMHHHEIRRNSMLDLTENLLDKLNSKFNSSSVPEPENTSDEQTGSANISPKEANALMLKVELARRSIVAIFREEKAIPDALLNKNNLSLARTDTELSGLIDQFSINELEPANRELVLILKGLIEKDLDVLNKAADKHPGLTRYAPEDPFTTLGGKPSDDATLSEILPKAQHLVEQELNFLTKDLVLDKGGDEGKRNAMQLAWRFENLLKTRPDVRIALGLADTQAVVNTWVKGLGRSITSQVITESKTFKERVKDILESQLPLKQDDLNLGEKIGRGGQGQVFSGSFQGTQLVAKLSNSSIMNGTLLREGLMQSAFHNNPHIPKIKGVVKTANDDALLVMDKVPGSNFLELVQKKGSGLPPQEALKCFSGMAKGLERMHALGFVHSDIKLQNVVLDENTQETRLIDFGLAYKSNPDDSDIGYLEGTYTYFSPEQANPGGTRTPAIDVYAMGTCLHSLIEGKEPHDDVPDDLTNREGLVRAKVNTQGYQPGSFDKPCWSEPNMDRLKALIQSCWVAEPTDRPSTAQIVQALNGETVVPAQQGESGLKSNTVSLLDVLRPNSPFR